MSATDEIQRLPEEGDCVIATIRQVTGHGAYLTLDEKDYITGLLHISEIATGWIRKIERYVRLKQRAVLKVIRVNKARGEVDTSRKHVTSEERKLKLKEAKKNDKAAALLDFIKSKLRLTDQQVHKIEDKIVQKYDYVYDAFEAVARNGKESIQNINLGQEVKNKKEEASKRIPITYVEIRATMEITSKRPDGIEIIKNTLASAQDHKGGAATTTITYIGAPRYRIVVSGKNFNVAEKFMNYIIEKRRSSIEKQQGTLNFVCQESRKSH